MNSSQYQPALTGHEVHSLLLMIVWAEPSSERNPPWLHAMKSREETELDKDFSNEVSLRFFAANYFPR